MGIFSKFEGKMEDTFEGAAGKIQTSSLSPVQIMKKAEKQMRREKVVSAGKEFAPTLYTVLVSAEDDRKLFGFYPTLAGECETLLAARAAQEGLAMDATPLVRFIVDESLKRGRIDVVAEMVSFPILTQLRNEENARYAGMAPQQEAEVGTPAHKSAPRPFSLADSLPDLSAPDVALTDNASNEQEWHATPLSEVEHALPCSQGDRAPFAHTSLQDIPTPSPVFGQQIFAPEVSTETAFPQHDGNQPAQKGSEPAQVSSDHTKPPLPYVPENEIDYSINYGEYTFNSLNFQDQSDAAASAPQEIGAQDSLPSAGTPAQTPVASHIPASNSHNASAVNIPAPAVNVFSPAAPSPQVSVPPTAVFPGQQAHGVRRIVNRSAHHASLTDTRTGMSYELVSEEEIIGRERACDISVGDPNMSRRHARIAFEPQGVWVITDLGSTNGTLVNGIPVNRRGLSSGDRILLGTTEFVFSVR